MENSKKEILMKNNIMVKAKYDLNVIHNKIFQLILFEFQKHKKNVIEDLEKGCFKLSINKIDIQKLINKKINSTTKGISDILIKLRKTDIYFLNKDINAWGNYGFINGFTYYGNEDVFEIEVSNKIYNLLVNYLSYTPINMEIFLSFKSFYSQRFYELLRLWSNSKHIITYTVDELKELLMLENKYEEYGQFKRRVINSAIKELNEKSMMQIEIKEHKVNRKVISIDFIVTDNDKRKYFQQNEYNNQAKQKKTYKENLNESKKLKFNNFDQREYDYDDLEKKLLGWDED